MATKLYLHNAATSVVGTLPGATTQSVTKATPDVTATGASTNRAMTPTIGASQVSQALTTLAISPTEQKNWFRRFCSDPLAAQTIAAQKPSLHIGASESNANSEFLVFTVGVLYLWRPSTGARIGFLSDLVPGVGQASAEPGTSETALSTTCGVNTTSQTAQNGDILIFELWSDNAQLMATGYTNTVFYDGTTEDSITTNAAYLSFPNDLTFFVPGKSPPFGANQRNRRNTLIRL